MTYKPEPVDTSNVALTAEYLKLTELLAQNTHELWAQGRLEQGWTYGPQRDDAQKLHPCLVPYEQLPEAEKQYDRVTALGVLKVLLALGYRFETDATTTQNLTAAEEQGLILVLQSLKDSSELNLASLLSLRRETLKLQPRTPEIYRVLGDAILQLGEPLLAYDVLAAGLHHWPQDLRLQQLLALALARSGATHRANALLLQLLQSGQEDEETIGLLARTHKDLWSQAIDTQERTHQLGLAAARYEQAYQLGSSVWTGINAATMAILMGATEKARMLASEVRQQCLAQLQAQPHRSQNQYWLLATLGEAALILQNWSEAETFYTQAAQVGQGRFGDLSSSRRNAMLLINYLGGDIKVLKHWFQIPQVAVFSGHMIDQPGRPQLRFPPPSETAVYQAIRDRLHTLDIRLGYASAACGADILFLEALLELKGEVHIVLPYESAQFRQDAVDVIPDGNWGDRFEHILDQATEVMIASKQKLQGGNVAQEYTQRLLHGLAKMRAEQLGTELVPLAVWDGKPGDGSAGTASAIQQWQQWGYSVEVIDLASILHQSCAITAQPSVGEPSQAIDPQHQVPLAASSDSSQQIMALLFADVVNFSRLSEEQMFPFLQYFLGAVAELIAKSPDAPVMKNTWGDGLYCVFSAVEKAGQFALRLCDLVQETDWDAKGLPEDLSLRIALHAGPVYCHKDPITGRTNYFGTHVNYTARIEPITPPGKVYASQAFAAMATSEGLKEFTCDYAGQTPWAKGYGTFPTYHVRRC
ncbi:MAG: DUF4071 domain-containing protein [Cyanothece sp. SIO1E1]|nr:DUF4071 domain-containing protein [Cyanothece sp. SIO1E1]